jgi:hypothetical protein
MSKSSPSSPRWRRPKSPSSASSAWSVSELSSSRSPLSPVSPRSASPLRSLLTSHQLVDVTKDGNCLFRAVWLGAGQDAERAVSHLGKGPGHALLRKLAVDHIRDHFAWTPIRIAQSENRVGRQYHTKKEYLKYVGRNKVWGGSMEIEALAEALDMTICTLVEFNDTVQCVGRAPTKLFIAYSGNNHYQAMVPIKATRSFEAND